MSADVNSKYYGLLNDALMVQNVEPVRPDESESLLTRDQGAVI